MNLSNSPIKFYMFDYSVGYLLPVMYSLSYCVLCDHMKCHNCILKTPAIHKTVKQIYKKIR